MMNVNIRRILIPVLVTGMTGAQGIWENRAALPAPRAEHAAVLVDSLIYLIGGLENSGHNATGQVWAYHTGTDTWDLSLPALNHPRASAAAVAIGDTIYVFGGRHMSTIVGAVERLIVGGPGWEVIGTMPQPRLGLGAGVQEGRIYLFGGKASRGMFAPPTGRVDIFTPGTASWTIGLSMNQARTAFGYARIAGDLICAGGSSLDPLSSVELFNTQSGWVELVSLEESRSNCAAVHHAGDFLILGGYTSNGLSGTNLILVDDQWQEFQSLLLPRYDHTAVASGDNIYVMGGRNGQVVLTSNERYSPVVSVTEDVPLKITSFSIGNPYPNPFNGSFSFELHIPVPEQVRMRINLHDLTGREVYAATYGNVTDGTRITVNTATHPTGSLSSGLYILTVGALDPRAAPCPISRRVLYLK